MNGLPRRNVRKWPLDIHDDDQPKQPEWQRWAVLYACVFFLLFIAYSCLSILQLVGHH